MLTTSVHSPLVHQPLTLIESQGIQLRGPVREGFGSILTPAALYFVVTLLGLCTARLICSTGRLVRPARTGLRDYLSFGFTGTLISPSFVGIAGNRAFMFALLQ